MKPRDTAARETQILLQLVARIKGLNLSGQQSGQTIELKCPCGEVILPPTPAIPYLADSQRGLLKNRIRSHLRVKHDLSEVAIRSIISDSFASN